MTSSTIDKHCPVVDRELISTKFHAGTKEFLENYRCTNGLRSHAEALRQIVLIAAGEFELANN